MWEFLNNVLEKAGVVAALYALTLLGVGVAARYVWKYVTALNKALVEAEKGAAAIADRVRAEEFAKRSEMRDAFEAEKLRLINDHAAEVRTVIERHRADAERYGARIEEVSLRLDAVRERHTDQMVALVEKSTKHIERIDQSISKVGTAVDVLIRVSDGR